MRRARDGPESSCGQPRPGHRPLFNLSGASTAAPTGTEAASAQEAHGMVVAGKSPTQTAAGNAKRRRVSDHHQPPVNTRCRNGQTRSVTRVCWECRPADASAAMRVSSQVEGLGNMTTHAAPAV